MLLLCGIIVDARAEIQQKTQEKLDVFAAVEIASLHCQKIEKLIHTLEFSELPDFTFLLGQYQTLIDRKNKQRFNVLMSLKVLENMGLNAQAYPFAGNCKIQDFQPHTEKLTLKTLLAFGTKQQELTYKIQRQKPYSWQIDDIEIAGKSLAKTHANEFRQNISFYGFDKFIENLCNDPSFSKLGCK
jgi:hypothetical protein